MVKLMISKFGKAATTTALCVAPLMAGLFIALAVLQSPKAAVIAFFGYGPCRCYYLGLALGCG